MTVITNSLTVLTPQTPVTWLVGLQFVFLGIKQNTISNSFIYVLYCTVKPNPDPLRWDIRNPSGIGVPDYVHKNTYKWKKWDKKASNFYLHFYPHSTIYSSNN